MSATHRRLAVLAFVLQALAAIPAAADDTPPSVPLLTRVEPNRDFLNVFWNPSSDAGSGVAHYKLYRDGALVKSTPGTATSDDRFPATEVDHSYQVSAVDQAGNESARSNSVAGRAASRAPTLGEQRVAAILVRFAERSDVPFDASGADALLFGAQASTSAYVSEVSYGRAWLAGSSHGWYVLPRAMTDYCANVQNGDGLNCDIAAMRADVEAEVLRDVDFTGVEYVAFVVHGMGDGTGAGGTALPFSATARNMDFAAWLFRFPYIEHELMHLFGLAHAGWWDCGDTAGPSLFDLELGGCAGEQYGDRDDVMGIGLGHVSAYHKAALGWLDPAATVNVDRDGEHVLAPLEVASSSPQALRIPIDPFGNEYVVEYRMPLGLDAAVIPNPGVQVRVRLAYPVMAYGETLLLGAHPSLHVPGMPFRDPFRKVEIEVLEVLPTHARVRVNGLDTGAADVLRADLAALSPRSPALRDVFPFDPGNPLTPTVVSGLRSGEDPDSGILTRRAVPLALYQAWPAGSGVLFAIKDARRATVVLALR